MNSKLILTISVLLLATMAFWAQELIPFQEGVDHDPPIFGKWGFKDNNGAVVIKPNYWNASYFSEGLAAVATLYDGLVYKGWGFIDTKGKMVIPAKYDYASDFSDGLARVQSSETKKWGFIDKTGKEVIPLTYFDAHSFSEGYAAVRFLEPRKWGFIDKTGKEAIPFIYDKIEPHDFFRSSFQFENGKAKVKKDGRTFYIDKTGKEIEDDNAVLQKMASAYQSGNFTEALKLALELAKKGNAAATNLLGTMYAQGQGATQNFIVARTYWEKASKLGDAAATGNIGLLYAQGWGVPQNITEAENWFKKGADMGDAQSMFNLGNLAFQKGNFTEAKQWIQKAKTAGHPQADIALQQIKQAESQTNPIKARDKQ